MTGKYLAVLLLMTAVLGLGLAQDAEEPDPLPLRRVVIPLERVAAEVERARPGVVLQIPRDEFESKVRRAREAAAAAKFKPRLLTARYAAQLSGTTLVGGSGHWQVQHDGPAPAMLSLPRFNLALSKIKVGNSDGVLGDVDGKTFGLAVERSGRHDVFFDWSLRGSVQADGLAFSLRLPACPLSIIELKLPTGQTLVADRNAGLVSGPMDAERPDLKTWRLQSSGRSQIEIVVRASSESSAPRLVLATSECKQQLVGNVVLADYDFRVEVAQGAATELVFEGDDVLAPYEITVRGAELASWRTERNDAQGQNKGEQATGDMAIRVQLREPLGAQGANLRVRCLAPRPANAAWLSPGLRLRQAVARGETLVLQTTAPLQIERFDPGQFRLVHSAADADGGHTIRLVDLNPEAAAPRRPRLWALGTPADLATREQTRWSIGPGVMTLKAEIACSLRRGSLFQLGARLPAGSWVVDSVSVEPADYLRTWTLAGPMLFVNLQKPLDPRHPLTLSVGLRSDLAAGRFIATAPIPEVRLNELSSRQGVYNIHVDASWNTALVQAPPSLAEPAAPEHPDDATAPRFTFVYRDQALAGALELRPRRPAFTARVRQHVTLADGRGAVSAQLRLQPIFGQPKFVDVFLAGGSADGWRASGNDDPTLTMERAPGPELFGPVQLFGTCNPLGAAANLLYRPRGRTYRVYFAKAAQGPIDVTLLGDIKPAVLPAWSAAVARLATASAWPDLALTAHQLARQDWAPQLWEPPLVTVLGAEHTEGVVRVNPQHHTVLQRRSRGLQEQRDTVSGLTQLFHHHTAYPPVLPLELALTTLSTRGAVLPRNPLESLVVTHYVACDGSAHHHVHIRAAGWTEATLPLAFGAADLTVLGAKIDGRWIELIQQEQEHEALHVRLPMPRDGAVHRLELLLASPPPATWWAPIGSIGQVEPTLPGPVSERRHRWRLAPGLAPLRREATYSLEPDRGTPTDALRRLWSAADSWIAGWTASLGEPWQEPQRRALDRAAADMQPVLSSATFGDAVERLALEAVKIPRPGGGGTALILDRQALAALGLRRGAALSPAVTPAGATGGANGGASRGANGGLWDRLGLVAAPTSQGLLLSCQACIEPQRRGAAAFHAALAAAAEAGQDQSGRYCRSDLWLSSPDEDPASWQWLPMLGASEADGWSEWLPLPANADRAALLVVRAAPLRWAGVALGGLLFIVLQRLRPRWRPAMAMRFLILSAVALGFALFAMPASLGDLAIWPLLAVAAHLTAEWIRCGRALAGSRARSIAPLVAFIIALGGVWRMTGAVVAQVENNDWLTVFYVNADGPRPVALVRPELMKRLEALERRSALAHESAVIVAAAYTGRPQEMTASGGPVRIDVQLDVHSFSERSTLHLPLTAVELLEGTFVDGAPAFPAAGAGKPGFVIPLVGRGFHRVTLAVLARPQLQGDHQEIRCGIPAVALNRLVWQAPAEQPGLQLAKGAGEESRTLLDGGKIREIRAQLGRQNVLHVRWLAAAAPSAVSHEVREAYWWDLDAGAASFTGQLRFTPSKTNLGHVEIALPDRLVVRSVELAATGTSASPRLAKWQIVGNEPARRLRVDFAAPASGSFILRFQAAPRLSFDGGQLSLRLPTPLDAKSVEGVLAYRLPGADAADKTSELNVTALAPEVFAKVWAQHGGTATTAPTRAYSFRRAALGGGLVLALRPLAPRADCEAVWRLTPAGAEATAEITWTASESLNLLEVQVPAGLKLAGVRGPQLLHWSVHGQRLQAWLTEAGTQARLELSGWLAKPLVKQRFVLPVWTLPNVEATVSTIRTTVPTGWIIEPERLSNLQPLGTDSPPSYQSKAQKYAGAFRVRPPGPAAEFDAFTRLEPRGGALAVLSTVAARASSGRLPAFSIRLRDWTAPVHLEASSAPLEQSHRREGNDQIWRLRFAPAGGRSVRIQLHSYLDASAPIAVPRLEVQGGTLREHLVGWPKEGLRVSGIQGLVEAPATLTARFADAELLRGQGGTVQRTEPGRPWRVLAQTSSASDAPAVRVLYAEQQAALTDGLRWLHRAKYLIQLKDARAFGIALPRRAELVNVTVDGRRVEPFRVAQQPPREQPPREQPLPEQRPSVQRLTVPLPERATLATVELAWQYPEAAEGWLRPDLAAPGLPQGGVAVHGVMLVPAGVGVRSLPPGWLVGDVHAAVGRFRAIAAADKDTAAPAGLAQHAPLARGLRRRLDFLLDIDPHLQAALPALRAELTVAGENPDEALPDAAPGTPLALGLPIDSAGLPLSWRVAAGETIAPVVLEEDAAGPDLGDWVRELLTLALVSMFLLSWLPGGIAWLTRLWPEAIAGLVLVGGVAWGPSVIGGALLAFAVLARVLSLIGLIRAWRVRSAPIAAATDSR